jgi:hypothetical protein
MRTADSIEESKAQKSVSSQGESQTKRKIHPNSLKNLALWVPGVSGNPGGKPRYDVGAQIARAVLEGNREAAYIALSKALLKGNAYVFKELCERGFGKLKETHEVQHTYQDVKDGDLNERISSILRELGLAAEVDEAGRVAGANQGAGTKEIEAETADVLPGDRTVKA